MKQNKTYNEDIKLLIQQKIFKNSDNKDVLFFYNSHLNFSKSFLFLGFTPSGNLKLGDIVSWGENGINPQIINRIGKVNIESGNIILRTQGGRFSLKIPFTSPSEVLCGN